MSLGLRLTVSRTWSINDGINIFIKFFLFFVRTPTIPTEENEEALFLAPVAALWGDPKKRGGGRNMEPPPPLFAQLTLRGGGGNFRPEKMTALHAKSRGTARAEREDNN